MSLIKKCDVKMHFAARRRRSMVPIPRASKPAAAALPAAVHAVEAIDSSFADDFSGEHCFLGGGATAEVIVTPEDAAQALDNPKPPLL